MSEDYVISRHDDWAFLIVRKDVSIESYDAMAQIVSTYPYFGSVATPDHDGTWMVLGSASLGSVPPDALVTVIVLPDGQVEERINERTESNWQAKRTMIFAEFASFSAIMLHARRNGVRLK